MTFDFFKKKKKEPKNLKQVLESLEKIEKRLQIFSKKLEAQEAESKKTFQKIGVVRFNPFKGVGGDQSFSIALLDKGNNGVVITSLYSRQGNRVYAKSIKQGKSEYALSKEEKEAIKRAIGLLND